MGVHFLTLELGARIVGLHHPGVGVYRPNDNPVLDWLQIKGRLRSNKDMLNRKIYVECSKLYAKVKPFGMHLIMTTAEKCRIRAFLCSKRSRNHDGELLSA